MDDSKLDNLVSLLQDRVGDDLRSVTKYDYERGGYEIVYAREGIMEQYDDDTIDKIVQSYEIDSMGKDLLEDRYENGEFSCVVRCFERGVAINLLENGGGVVIGLEAETLSTYNTFIEQCKDVLAAGQTKKGPIPG